MGKLSRLRLHNMLEKALGSNKVYYQPPENVKLEYPCIVYHVSNGNTNFASNLPYKFNIFYQVLFISRDPDDEIREKIAMLPTCRYDRAYKANDLNYDVFRLYI